MNTYIQQSNYVTAPRAQAVAANSQSEWNRSVKQSWIKKQASQ